MKKFIPIIAYSFLTLYASQSNAKGIGNGSSGSASISGTVNRYAAVTSINNTSTTFTGFTVDSTSIFAPGDLALVIQMQGVIADVTNTASYGTIQNYKSAGNFEYVVVDSITVGVVKTSKIQKTYDTGAVIQLVKVPQYVKVEITNKLTAMPWNGKKGGIVAIDATDSIILRADIYATGSGFRGAVAKTDGTTSFDDTSYVQSNGANAMKGEGIAGRGDAANVKIYGRGNIANGGGGGNNHNAGGGGGANAGCGGFGGWGYYSYIQQDSRGIGGISLLSGIVSGKIFMGGGGGAGQVNDNFQSVPGNGGGIIILSANTIAGNSNNVESNGTDGSNNMKYDGASGGGAGGSVLLFADYITDLNTNVRGGKGGDPGLFLNGHLTAPGGGGGGGLVWVKKEAIATGNKYDLGSGAAGICDTSNFGATAGCAGTMLESLEITHPPTSIAKLNANRSFMMSLHPNPATNYVRLTLPTTNPGKNELTVFDIKGSQCYKATFDDSTKTIDISHFQPGIYIFRVMNENGVGICRLIK